MPLMEYYHNVECCVCFVLLYKKMIAKIKFTGEKCCTWIISYKFEGTGMYEIYIYTFYFDCFIFCERFQRNGSLCVASSVLWLKHCLFFMGFCQYLFSTFKQGAKILYKNEVFLGKISGATALMYVKEMIKNWKLKLKLKFQSCIMQYFISKQSADSLS